MIYSILSIKLKLQIMLTITQHMPKKKNIESLLKTLEQETTSVLNWFHINEMKSNDGKCHLIVANRENYSITLNNEVNRCVRYSGFVRDKT